MPHLAPETLTHHNWPRLDTSDRMHYAVSAASPRLSYHCWSLARVVHFERVFTHDESERVEHTWQHKEIGCQHCILHWVLCWFDCLFAIVDDADCAPIYCWLNCLGGGLGYPRLAYGLLLVQWME